MTSMHTTKLALILALFSLTAILGCERHEETPGEKVGEAIEDAGDKLEDAAE